MTHNSHKITDKELALFRKISTHSIEKAVEAGRLGGQYTLVCDKTGEAHKFFG